jgi:tetratricopeptide (TPR) repeat protein/DNA-binding winged helix-turn-helix (wHTH) protein
MRYRNQLRKSPKSQSEENRLLYEFGPFSLDVTEGVLLRNGVPVAITSKAVHTLLVLVQNSGQVVSKDVLMKSVWPDTAVEENNLNQSVSAIRKALGDNVDGKPYIETVPRRGYRFATQVTESWVACLNAGAAQSVRDDPTGPEHEQSDERIEGDVKGSASRPGLHQAANGLREFVYQVPVKTGLTVFRRATQPWLLAATVSLLLIGLAWTLTRVGHLYRQEKQPPAGIPPLAQGRYLAIVPFRVANDETSFGYVAEGLAAALSAGLMQSPGVHVASARAVDHIDRNAPLQNTARQLGANLLVVGTLEGGAENMQIHVSLEDVADGLHMWHGDFSGTTRDIFLLEDQIYSKLATALGVRASGREEALHSARSTESVQAYDLYLRGKDALRQRQQVRNVQAAIHFQEEALKIDPDFALAYAGLADASSEMYRQEKVNFWAEKALNAAQQAVRLNGNIAEVHFVLGSVYRMTGRLDDAIEEEKRGLEIAPGSDEGYRRLGQAYLDQGRPEEALQAYQKAIQIDPYYWFNFSALGEAYFRLGKYEEALGAFRKVTELEPANTYGHDNVGAVYLSLGKWGEAIREYQRALELEPNFVAYSNLGTALFYLKRYDEAAGMFERAVALSPTDPVVLGNLGDAYRWSGQSARARATYDIAIALAYKELEVNPRRAGAMLCLALYYAKKGQRTPALEFIRRARSLDPANVQFLYGEAEVQALVGQPDQAVDALREALRQGYPFNEAAADPELSVLQARPAFKQLMAEAAGKKT